MEWQKNAAIVGGSVAASGTGCYLLTSAVIAHEQFDRTLTMGFETVQFAFSMAQMGMAGAGLGLGALGAMGLTYAGHRLYNRIMVDKIDVRIANARAIREASYAQLVGDTLFTNRNDLVEYVPSLTQINPKSALVDHRHRRLWTAPMGAATDQLSLADDNEPELPDIVDVMATKFQRILLVAGSGTGKTNLLKWLVKRLIEAGENIKIIDPHSPSQMLGIDCIGAGLGFDAIRNCMLDIMVDVDRKFKSGEIAQDGNTANNHWLIIDEFKDIYSKIPDVASAFLQCLLIRGRKAGYRFAILSQNDTVDSLGLKGDKALLKGAERVELVREWNNDDRRRAFVGWQKSNRIECSVPGVFPDYPEVPASQLIIDQPQPYTRSQQAIIIAALLQAQAGASNSEILKLAGVGRNGRNVGFLNKVLEKPV